MVGKVKDGVRTLLYQAGFPPLCWPWAVKYFCHMHNMQEDIRTKPPKPSPYFKRYGEHFKGERIPFGAYIEYLPASANHDIYKAVMAPRICPGVFIGYFENCHGLTEDYVVLPLADLTDAKHDPNDYSSWHVTPTRSGRVIFDKTNPNITLKQLYQQARETIWRREEDTG